MESRFHRQAGRYQDRNRRRQCWYRAVTALSCVVVFCTTYALILPAITMETPRVLDCPLAVHAHTGDCYDDTGNLRCGQADFVVHTHTGGCYDESGQLVCPLPEIEAHTHTDACYTEQSVLICGLEESDGHQHAGNCYAARQGALICGSEDPAHSHGEGCYEQLPLLTCGLEETAGHRHGESCYTEKTLLVCGGEEGGPGGETRLPACVLEETMGHAHGEDCYAVKTALVCGSGDAEHVHTGDCYAERSYPACGLAETAGHAHGEDCYAAETAPGSGDPAHVHTEDCFKTVIDLTCGLEKGAGAHIHSDGCYVLTCGIERGEGAHRHTRTACYMSDLPLTCGREEIVLHTHSGGCYDESGALICGQLEILEHVHGDDCFRIAETAGLTYLYEDGAVAAEVTLPADSGIPADAALAVRPITAAEQDYETLVRQAEEAMDRAVTEIALYDISFRTPDGAYIPVADAATVSLRFKETILPEGTGEVAVLHYQEAADLPVALGDVDVECGQNGAVSSLTFRTEGFSVFGVAALADTQDADGLDGKSFAIVNRLYGDLALTADSTTVNNVSGLASQSVTVTEGSGGYQVAGKVAMWKFTRTENGTYYISTTVDSVTKYLYLCETSYDGSNDGRGSLTLRDTPQEITVTLLDSGAAALTSGRSAVNLDSGARDFWCYSDAANPGSNSQFILAEAAEAGTVPGITPKGTVINLFDYWVTGVDEAQPSDANKGINSGHALKFNSSNNDSVGTVNRWTQKSGGVLQGIVAGTLGEDGYPMLSGNGSILNGASTESLAYLFDPDYTGNAYRNVYRNVGGLLQEDETSGYYYYDSTQNYAYFDEDAGRFTLYKDWAVQYNGSEGMFFPFNDYPNQNLSADNSGLNHYFGMSLTSRFVHRYGGYTNSSKSTPTTFSFSGDDDVWIFIDNVLVADLGGIHDKASVTIDFAKGAVSIDNVYGKGAQTTYFSDIFAGTGVELQTNGSYTTFKDNSYHVLKFYYLERGGNASNLKVQYNLASYPPTGINKVNQYGEKVAGAEFAVYKADQNWNIIDTTPAYTGTTDANGEMVFVDKDEMPYTLAELKGMFGEYFILKETQPPPGYRLVNEEILLHIQDNVLLCENTYDSGVWADTNLQVSAPNTIRLVDGSLRNVVTSSGAENGRIFAVVLKYIGERDANGNATALAKQESWAPVYGTGEHGFTVVKVADGSAGAFISAVIDTAKKYVESDNVFTLSASGALQGSLNGMPGNITTYHYMLPEGTQAGKTQYTVAYYWTEANSLAGADVSNTYRINADDASYSFDRVFGATINVPNLTNRMFVQKFNEDGDLVNGASFALYSVKEDGSGIHYVADDGRLTDLAEGAYTVDGTTGVITAKDGSYVISPAKNAHGGSLVVTTAANGTGGNDSGEDGTGIFTRLNDGQYYMREIAAPNGYALNPTEVMVLVTDDAIYANAGTAGDGVTVARGPGYVVATLDQFASEGNIDNTLTWVYERMRISGESTSFDDFNHYTNWGYLKENRSPETADAAGALTTYLVYDTGEGANTLFNYTVNKAKYSDELGYTGEQIAAVTRRLYTSVGWSYYELYQDHAYGSARAEANGADYKDLSGQEIANLFSRSVYVQMTDPKISTLEISKTVSGQPPSGAAGAFAFTVRLYEDAAGTIPLTGEYLYTVYDVQEDGTRTPAAENGNPLAGTVAGGGTLTLRDGQTAVIQELPAGAYYQVTEASYPRYAVTAVRDEGEPPADEENDPGVGRRTFIGPTVTGRLEWTWENGAADNTSTAAYTNTYRHDLLIRKLVTGTATPLPGAKFVLYRQNGNDESTRRYCLVDSQGDAGWVPLSDNVTLDMVTLTSGSDGKIIQVMLPDGTYFLRELSAPAGYTAAAETITVTVKDGTFADGGDADDPMTLSIYNDTAFELPKTGGGGIFPYTIGGALLMALGLLCGYELRRKRERRSTG